MGEVYRADDLKLGQPVAIKLLAASGARTGLVERSVSEVRLARTIAHPNVCRVYDIGEADGWWYLSMELVDGETLRSLLRRIGRLPAEKALDMARQLCAGLAAAHDRGVLHRDLKPSNIMVDGRGRIRITDFGLAVPSGDWTIGEVAGTPAYMSPEQVAGDRATERTDLYSLGLVLYELYTGRRLFAAQTLEERERVNDEAPLAHSLPGMDAEIQRVIHSCLERDPEKRPESAVAIAASLPGGDPVAAAIARGAVPSPEMIAAAGPRGAVHPAHAWAMLGTILVGLLAIAQHAHVVNVSPSDVPKPPAVLAERARTILASIGADVVGMDTASWFDFDDAPLAGASTSGELSVDDKQTRVKFVYRQGPRYLVPQNLYHFVTDADPPSDLPGMATVTLDPLGRLIHFTRIPQEGARGSADAPTVAWAAVFREAGLDEREFVAVTPDHFPRVPHDQRHAWTRIFAGVGSPRVRAATLNTNVVQFDIAYDSQPAPPRRDVMSTGRSPAAELAVSLVLVSLFAGACVLARYNLRRGQGDRLGARRLGIAVVCIDTLSAMLRAHHVPVFTTELFWLLGALGMSLVWGGFTWLMYISLEPHLRRVWPRTLISWTRLLSGRVRDPLVGRDVLIGMLAGILVMSMVILRVWISGRPAPAETISRALESLSSIRSFANMAFTHQIAAALMYALGGAFLLLLIRVIVRKTWLAMAAAVVVGLPFVPGGGVPVGWELILVLTPPLVIAIVFFRVGLLAQFSLLVTDLLIRVPLTLDSDAWYFGNSLVVLLGLAALATGAFLISLGGRPAFGSSPA